MEIIKKELKRTQWVVDVKCDCCGKSCKKETYVDKEGVESYSFEYMELKAHWGFNSKKDLEMWTAQVCEKCVDEKFGFINFEITPLMVGGAPRLTPKKKK